MARDDRKMVAYRVIEVRANARDLPADAWVTVHDAARFLGVSGEQVRRLVAGGTLAALKVHASPGPAGFRFLISTDDLNQRKREVRDKLDRWSPRANS
jgi:hypothetical protein